MRIRRPSDDFTSWKTWERGAPELCVEIASRSDEPEPPWEEKLQKYLELGCSEVVRFDWRAGEGQRLRVWDRIGDVLVQRIVQGDRTECVTLALHWVVVGHPEHPDVPALRLARDVEGVDLLATRAEAEASRAETEASRADREARLRETAERRLAELEAKLRRGD